MDPRIQKIANLLVNYSLQLKAGELFVIKGESCSIPLINATYAAALQAGALPYVQVTVPETQRLLLKEGSQDQMKYISPMSLLEMQEIGAFLTIWSSSNTRTWAGVDPERQTLRNRFMKPLNDIYFKRMGDKSLRWCGTLFPADGEAQEAGMSLAEWEELIFAAGHLDSENPVTYWQKFSEEQIRLTKILDQTEEILITADGTDLKMKVDGRKWINCDGKVNFPDGEIFTGPIEDSVNGIIKFSYPAIFMGHEVENVVLEFIDGRVVSFSSTKGQEFLAKTLDTDEGSRKVGELGIGTSEDDRPFCKHMLLDEKMRGTIHLALGRSLQASGGLNKSTIHWDMLCDMSKGGEIIADGKVIYRNGKFII